MYTVSMTKLLKDSGLELSQLAVEELDRLAAYQGESKKSIAKAIGMGRPTVSAKLNGRKRITLDEFISMAQAINVNPVDVLAHALAEREVRDEHGA